MLLHKQRATCQRRGGDGSQTLQEFILRRGIKNYWIQIKSVPDLLLCAGLIGGEPGSENNCWYHMTVGALQYQVRGCRMFHVRDSKAQIMKEPQLVFSTFSCIFPADVPHPSPDGAHIPTWLLSQDRCLGPELVGSESLTHPLTFVSDDNLSLRWCYSPIKAGWRMMAKSWTVDQQMLKLFPCTTAVQADGVLRSIEDQIIAIKKALRIN